MALRSTFYAITKIKDSPAGFSRPGIILGGEISRLRKAAFGNLPVLKFGVALDSWRPKTTACRRGNWDLAQLDSPIQAFESLRLNVPS